jgi:hypothetical protein
MKSTLLCLAFIFLSCSDSKTDAASDENQSEKEALAMQQSGTSADTTITFLWRELRHDPSVKAEVSILKLNTDYINSITDYEKAALGYVATFVGNECEWDGKATDDRSNLDCSILRALGLGYQCSEEHLGFLRETFANDQSTLIQLEDGNCPTVPNAATVQTAFDEIKISTASDQIIINFKAAGFNVRDQMGWNWSENITFQIVNEKLKVVQQEKSEVVQEKWVYEQSAL